MFISSIIFLFLPLICLKTFMYSYMVSSAFDDFLRIAEGLLVESIMCNLDVSINLILMAIGAVVFAVGGCGYDDNIIVVILRAEASV